MTPSAWPHRATRFGQQARQRLLPHRLLRHRGFHGGDGCRSDHGAAAATGELVESSDMTLSGWPLRDRTLLQFLYNTQSAHLVCQERRFVRETSRTGRRRRGRCPPDRSDFRSAGRKQTACQTRGSAAGWRDVCRLDHSGRC